MRTRIVFAPTPRRVFVILTAVAVLMAGCTTTRQVTVDVDRPNEVFGMRTTHRQSAAAQGVSKLPSIRSKAKPIEGPNPVGLEINTIDVTNSDVIPVGVDLEGSFDVPTHDEVGWYKYGPSPGEFGSAVLAAHVVLNGADGVFRHLTELSTGDDVTVRYDDGSARDFTVVGLDQYEKADLPLDDIFRRDGDPQLVLITCGGDYDPNTRRYEDNIVAYAVPT